MKEIVMTIEKSCDIINGQDISRTVIQQGEVQNVYNNGSATSVTVNNNGTQNVYNNGSTTSTTVNNNGAQNVYNNASAYVTTVNNGGVQNIHDGGYGFYTTVNQGGYITTTNNGISFQPYIQSNGYEDIGFNKFTQSSSVGSSVSAQLYGGSQYVYSGSIASNASVFDGGASIILGYGSAVNTSVTSGGRQEVYGNASHTTLDDTAVLNVTEGGRTYDTVVQKRSAENVFQNGSATKTIVENNGAQNVYNNGSTTSTIVNNNGAQNVYNNASAYVTIVNNSGAQNVFNNGKAYYTTVNQGGYLTTNSDGKSYGAVIEQGAYEDVGYNNMANVSAAGFSYDAQVYGSQYVYSGSIASNATVFSDGQQTLLNAGSATNLVLSGGTVNVSSGGTIKNDVTFVNSGTVNVYSGAIVSTALNNHGTENIYLGGSAVNTIINNKSLQNISGGAIALNTRVNSGGQQILSGTPNAVASATGTTVFAGGQQTILSGGQAGEINMSGGIVNISAGGNINGNINFDTIAGGAVNVFSGASISSQITNNGALYIYSGGKTDNVTIKGGYEHVLNGGTINNTTVNNMGNIYINSGGTANGLTVNSGGNTSIFTDGVASNVDIGDLGIVVVNGGNIADTTITYGGILNVTSGNIGYTVISSGGALLVSTDSVTPTDDIVIKAGGIINERQALQDVVINNITRNNFDVLFNDPTLFKQTNSISFMNTGTHKNIIPSIDTNTDKTADSHDKANSGDLNDLLNNPKYFAPVNATQQSRMFVAPETFSESADELPSKDGDGNTITWLQADDSPDGIAIDLRRYHIENYTGSDSGNYSSFLPQGSNERVWGIGSTMNTSGNSLSNFGLGGVLLFGPEASASVISGATYTRKVHIAEGATLNADQSSTTLNDVYIYNTAKLNATRGTIRNLYIDNGGVANIADPAKLTGTLSLDNGGKANITTSTGGVVSLAGTENKGLVISGKAAQNGTTVASTIMDFDGHDSLTLQDIQRSDVASVKFDDADHVTITLKDGSSITLNIIGIEQTGYTLGANSDGSLTFEACFLAGTAITTQDGIMAVETINIGDIIKVFDWKTGQTNNAVVSWVGKKYTTVKTGMPDDLAGYPVRILKDAITDNVPNQDLLVTPEHCLFFAGNFIPARMLVNDRSIYYDRSITAYDYYHIETETHSVIWANGMLTESYLDTGNKKTFANAQKIVTLFSDAKNWETDAAAPLNVNQDIVKPIYDQINKRALKAHHTLQTTPLSLTNDPNLYLVTEQRTVIQPHSCNKGKYIFKIPKNINIVNIISRTARPCQAIGPYIDDRRKLGVLVSNILVINHNNIQEITDHLSNPELDGWDVIEQSPCRWTNGNAKLNINSDNNDKKVLIICLLAAGPYIIQNKEKYKMAV